MPTSDRREDAIVALFLSAYEHGAWKDSKTTPLDQLQDGAVEVLATRPDGRTLALEHTLIEPFEGDRADLDRFLRAGFLAIEDDPALVQTDRVVEVDIPRGALPNGSDWREIAKCVHHWLRAHLASIPDDTNKGFECPVSGHGNGQPATLRLWIRIVPSPGFQRGPLVRRYGQTDVTGTVEKALRSKLRKLVATPADVRVLLLERAQFRLDEREIWVEIQRRRREFPELEMVSEIWFAETVFYDSSDDPGWRDAIAFHLYAEHPPRLVADYQFFRGVLIERSRNGVPEVMPGAHWVLGG
jgi:hypothetical protein